MAQAFEMGSGSNIKSYGKRKIAGYTELMEALCVKIQPVDVKKVLEPMRKINLGGKVAGLDGERSFVVNEDLTTSCVL